MGITIISAGIKEIGIMRGKKLGLGSLNVKIEAVMIQWDIKPGLIFCIR